MTREELRQEAGYIDAHSKIESYSKGFRFEVDYTRIPTEAKLRAMTYLLNDCVNEGLIESVAIYVSLQGEFTAESFVRL